MDSEGDAGSGMKEEVRKMMACGEFEGEKKEFSPITDAHAARAGKTGDETWNLLKEKIVEYLPELITSGILHCSLTAIGEQEVCRQAARAQQKELLIRQVEGFPAIPFETFFPYLEFVLRAGPIDLMTLKSRFKVEGKLALKEAKILFSGDRVESFSGTGAVMVKIYLRTGSADVYLHQFERILRFG